MFIINMNGNLNLDRCNQLCISCVNCFGIFNRMQICRLLVLRHVLQTVTIYAKNIARWAGIAGPVKHIGNQFHHGPFLIVKLILLIVLRERGKPC
ncbi:hypothetical protein C0638_10355 [Paenibacillus sp. lzh-N1]|nr:hypothetical protein C0638_10355 [Paenibacillus sp. lzh-N1]